MELIAGASGNANFSFNLTIADDTTTENAETFMLMLSEQTQGTMITTESVTTTIAASDMTPSGMWVIRTTTPTVNEAESARYNVEYDGIPAEQGSIVSILVTVGFPLANPASADDIDGVHGTPGTRGSHLHLHWNGANSRDDDQTTDSVNHHHCKLQIRDD